MLVNKNIKNLYIPPYKDDEPSPKGLGYCAKVEKREKMVKLGLFQRLKLVLRDG